jgi:uncharacterized protein YgiM (DUF1202 family)
MAPRKSTSRKKRPARGKSSGQSAAAVVTVGAIVALGAAALWATSQSRSPTASVSGLFRSNSGSSVARTNPPAPRTSTPSSERKTAQVQTRTPEVTAPAPIRRPQVNVGEQKQVAMLAPRVENKPAVQIIPPKPATQSAMPALPPVGRTTPDDNSRHASGAFKIPKAIVAKQALTIREKAWDQAKTVGRVEKGREMRSYAKVGRWHRVVVPSTNIIGWVQEDQLIFKNQPRQAAASRAVAPQQSAITTGSIRPAPASKTTSDKPQNTGLIAPVYPQQPVGK